MTGLLERSILSPPGDRAKLRQKSSLATQWVDPEILRPIAHRAVAHQETLTLLRRPPRCTLSELPTMSRRWVKPATLSTNRTVSFETWSGLRALSGSVSGDLNRLMLSNSTSHPCRKLAEVDAFSTLHWSIRATSNSLRSCCSYGGRVGTLVARPR
jgi:hypothetical protein